jgi:homoserine kinase type II
MALLTPLSLDDARAYGRLFDLEVVALRPVPHGSVNSNFELGLQSGGRAFLRIYEESNHEAVVAQNRLLRHLADSAVPTPVPMLRRHGEGDVAGHEGKPLCIFPFWPGSWICQARVTEARLEAVGGALARVHRAGEDYPDPPADRFTPRALEARLEGLALRSDLPGDIAALLDELRGRVGELCARAGGRHDTVIHGDLFRDNVLWHDDGRLSGLLDFESASAGSVAFDLTVTLLAWCYDAALEQPLARALLRGYRAVRSLREHEAAQLYDEARAAALRFAVTRITDYELRPRGVVIYKDYRRFIARLRAVEAIGPERFAAWIGAAV